MMVLYWFICFIIGLVPAIFVYLKDRRKSVPVKWLPALLRFGVCACTAVLLLAPAFPSITNKEEKPLLLWLQDNSSSIAYGLGKDSNTYNQAVHQLWQQWGAQYKIVPFAFGAQVQQDSIFRFTETRTDINTAIQQAVQQYQDQNIGAIILPSDGIYNIGANPTHEPIGAPIPIYTIGIGDSTVPKDIAVTRVYANKTVALNSNFEVWVDVRAEKMMGLNTVVRLQQQGSVLATDALHVNTESFQSTLRFQISAKTKGFHKYTVSIPVAAEEFHISNNTLDFFVEVIDNEIKVLIAAAAPHPDIAAIKAALEDVPQYKVTTSIGNTLPTSFNNYHVIIAHQLPSINGINPQWGNVPVWYILGKQTMLTAFNSQQEMLKLNSMGSITDALPSLESQFGYFTVAPNVRTVLEKLPPLWSPFGKYTLGAGTGVLLRQKIGAVESDYPLWAFQQGSTPLAVLCGEGLWRWRIYEYKNFNNNEVVDGLIRQTVNLLSVKKDDRPFKLYMDKYIFSDNENVVVVGELKNENGELVNAPNVSLKLVDKENNQSLPYVMDKTAQSYRLSLGLLASGNYSLQGSTQWNGKNYTAEIGFVVESIPLERLRTHADFGLLTTLAHQSGGAFIPYAQLKQLTDSLLHNESVKPIIRSETKYSDWIDKQWLFFVIVLLATAEWLLRKYWNV